MSTSTDGSRTLPLGGIWGWFPNGQQNTPGWRLDAVSLLAVIGESSIAEHAQVITASVLCLLPRIIPAPQALLKSNRPPRLPEFSAKTSGVYSGIVLDTVGFFANIIHPLEGLQPYTFKVFEIKHRDQSAADVASPARRSGKLRNLSRRTDNGAKPFASSGKDAKEIKLGGEDPVYDDTDKTEGDVLAGKQNHAPDVEQGGLQPGITRRRTLHDLVTDVIADPRSHRKNSGLPGAAQEPRQRPAVPPALYSPVHILSFVSFLLTMAMIGAAAYWQDGTAILAVSLVSVAGSVVSYASWWRPILMNRSQNGKVPKGDVVIRTREGAFILVKCTEEVARELYSGTEVCEYHAGERMYRVLMALGTILLMVAVVLLGNCNWNAQVFIGAGYIMLNGFYWGLGLIPKKYFWDLSRYEVHEANTLVAKNYTEVLWNVIYETKRIGWIERSGAAPGTNQWKCWLREAEAAARAHNHSWEAVARKDAIMKTDSDTEMDQAEQRAPIDAIDTERPVLVPEAQSETDLD